MKKWNCNIVKDMYDRVIHRKYGLLCSDDTSNEAFLESYRNRLDCEIVDVSCYGNNKPCSTISIVECGFSVNITYEVTEYSYCPVTIEAAELEVVYSANPLVGWRGAVEITSLLNSITSHPNYTGGLSILNYKIVDNTGALVGGYLPNELPGTLQTIIGNLLNVYRINPIWTEVYFILEIEAQFDFGQGNHTLRFTYNQTIPKPIINSGTLTYDVTPSCEDLNPEAVYVFTATPTGNVGTVTYTWNFNGLYWNLISQTGNTLTLQPLYPIGGSFVSVLAIDSRDCPATDVIEDVNYLAGCTDPDAINYNPDATYNDGSCYYIPLTLTTGYTCDEFENGDFCATVTGGVPPYTLVGYPGGGEIITTNGGSYCEILFNGIPWSLYAVDSDGNVTPIQTGNISCPFNCGSVSINPDVTIDCLIDGLGNLTGQGQVYASPFGGTAPYTITISVNGAPAVPFVNGSTYNNGDLIQILVTDANGCQGDFNEIISCPPTVPGEFFGDCEELANYLKDNGAAFPVTVTIMDASPSLGGGYTVNYDVSWGAIGIPAPLTLANFSTVAATIENNTTTNLVIPQLVTAPSPGSFGSIIPFTGNLVLNNSVSILSTYTTPISCGGSGLRSAFVPPSSPNLQLSVKLEFTVVIGSLVCHLCGSALFSLDYDPCENPFTPVSQTVNLVVLSVCP